MASKFPKKYFLSCHLQYLLFYSSTFDVHKNDKKFMMRLTDDVNGARAARANAQIHRFFAILSFKMQKLMMFTGKCHYKICTVSSILIELFYNKLKKGKPSGNITFNNITFINRVLKKVKTHVLYI